MRGEVSKSILRSVTGYCLVRQTGRMQKRLVRCQCNGFTGGRQSPDSTKGSRSSPLNTVACFIVISGSGVAVLVVRLFSWAVAFESAPIVGANSKRISLVADFALIFDPTSAGPACCSFYCSRPGRGANPVASPLQKNQLAAPPPSCRYFAGAVTSCSCYGSCLLLLLCHL